VLAIVAKEKALLLGRKPKAIMYIEDLAEFVRVVLTTTEMTFECGWLRIQFILFCQLAAITASRPQALLDLRYRHLELTLIRDPGGGRPRLFIYLTPEFTKKFLGEKEPYVSVMIIIMIIIIHILLRHMSLEILASLRKGLR
jgi:hypothetical protein